MPDYQEDLDRYGFSPQSHRNSHVAADDYSDSKSRSSHEYERGRSKSKDGENGLEREKDRGREREVSKERDRERYGDIERDREKHRDRHRDKDHNHHREHHRGRSERRGRDKDDDEDYYRGRESDRLRDDHSRDERRRHRSRSASKGSYHRSRSPSLSKRSRSPSLSKRSRSPSLSKRSRSPSQGKRRVSGFDMAPPAPALITTAAAAIAAQLPVPGTTPSIPGMFPNMFPLTNPQIGALPVMPVHAMTQQATRHARRVYVGGLPPTANEQSVAIFFSQVMTAIGGNTAGAGDAVVNVYINHEKKFAFVEMRSVEEASNAMALDGIILEGTPVKVRRPTDYNPTLAATLGPSQPNPNLNLAAVGLSSGSVVGLEGPDRIFVGGLPYYFTEAQIRELLESFGPLRGFNLVKDRETGNSKGYAFCVYQDPSVTDIACAALNGIKMGDKTLTVRRANQGTVQPKPEQENVLLHAQQQIALQRLMLQPGGFPTRVVCLTNVVTADELRDDGEYEDIMLDMRDEAQKFGSLVNVVIPRPNADGQPSSGVGKVFLEYGDVDGATKARSGMNGRKFGGNQVVAVYYPEEKFAMGDYDG